MIKLGRTLGAARPRFEVVYHRYKQAFGDSKSYYKIREFAN